MRPVPSILLAMCLLARPNLAGAAPASLGLPARLHAGERVEVRWTGLPANVREVELELSLDDGRWIRISPELEAAEGHFHWRVPAVASARARLRLRGGGEAFERELATSRELRIEAPPGIALERSRSDEWWQVGAHAAARGWQPASNGAALANGGAAGEAVSVPDPFTPGPVALRTSGLHDLLSAAALPPPPAPSVSAIRRHPMRD